MNRGSVTVKSRKGKGSTFTLQFIADRIEDRSELQSILAPQPAPLEPYVVPKDASGKKLVLFVEDDEETQEYMSSILSRDYAIRIASNAEAAWAILERDPISLVLMDLSLQGEEDGISLTKRIRKDGRFDDLPVIAVTAHAFPKDRIQSIEAGCNAYFSKPFQIEELKATMQTFLGEADSKS
jgi:CheY-like chemotaxis protein